MGDEVRGARARLGEQPFERVGGLRRVGHVAAIPVRNVTIDTASVGQPASGKRSGRGRSTRGLSLDQAQQQGK